MSSKVNQAEQLSLLNKVPEGISPHCRIVDRSNCDLFNNFFYTVRKPDGKIKTVSWRRNGKTKVWVTRPNEFRIPIKFGMGFGKSDYHYITEADCHLWWGSV